MEKSRGLGDSVHKVLKITGVNKIAKVVTENSGECLPCNKRREKLNEMFPYKK